MAQVTLGKKISGLAAILLLLMIASTLFAIVKMHRISTELKEIVEEDIPLSAIIAEVTINQLSQSVWVERGLRYAGNTDAEATQKISDAEKKFAHHGGLADEALDKGAKIATRSAESAQNDNTRRELKDTLQQLVLIEEEHQEYEHHVEKLFALLRQGMITDAVAMGKTIEQEEEHLGTKLESFLVKVEKSTRDAAQRAEDDEEKALRWLLIIAGINLVLGISLSFKIIRSITLSIDKVICALNTASMQLNSASGEVSAASQSLAEGASEQAAALEETSSSMEELSAMTRQNAENADHADTLMKEANLVIDRANDSMSQMTVSMNEIASASEETSKIIKTIDEIAFQTNLLALNAAVEAARAGEAGAGFAVVADEVRNLAMRAAEAAKDTSQLIESTVQKVSEGTQLVASTNEAFSGVAESADKVGSLLAEIAGASKEQANGIGQINLAVSEMDKVTQQNSATAEESAAASEELNAQSSELVVVVDELAALVGTGEAAGSCARIGKDQKTNATSGLPATRRQKTVRKTGRSQSAALPASAKQSQAKTAPPAEIIPMDNEDFEDF